MNFLETNSTILKDTADEAEALASFMAMILHEDEPHNIQLDIVKEAIASGQYKINYQHVVNKLLEFSSETEVSNQKMCFAD